MKSLILVPALFCLFFNYTFAQKHYTTTLRKNSGQEVFSLDSADFISVVSEPDAGSNLFNVQELYKDKTPKLVGKSKEYKQIVYQGMVQTFYPSGKKHEIFNYADGTRVGDSYEYYPNGKIYAHKKIVTDGKDGALHELLLDCRDSTGTVWASNGEGIYKVYTDNFKMTFEQGPVKDGLKEGEWKGDNGDKVHNITFTEQYSNGILKSGISVNADDNKTYTYNSRFTDAQYPGGLRAFDRYVSDKGKYPPRQKTNHFAGSVTIDFAVLPDGTISDCKITTSPDISFSEEAKRLFLSSPKWIPATAFGRPIKVSSTMSVLFGFSARNDDFITIGENAPVFSIIHW